MAGRRVTPARGDVARPARLDDVGTLGALMVEFYAEAEFPLAPAAAERTFAALLEQPALGGVWLLESGGQPAGFVVLTVSFSMEYGGWRGFVDDFFVAKPFRRRGLGALGLQAVKDECARRGVRALLVETGPANEAALGVYRRAGFADTGHALLKVELGRPLHAAEARDPGAARARPEPIRMGVASDHAGFRYKSLVARHLRDGGHEVQDLGAWSEEAVDYPDFIRPLALAVSRGTLDRGFVFGGSGNGEAMAANRVHGVRCAVAWDRESARLSRAHNDANVLSLGQRLVAEDDVLAIVDVWLGTPFDGGRHVTRIRKLDEPPAEDGSDPRRE